MKDGRIAPVDFGIVGRLTYDERENLRALLIGFVTRDANRIVDAAERMGVLPESYNRRDLTEDILLFIDKYLEARLGEIDMAELFSDAVSFLRRHQIRVRTEYMLLGKALSTYEEVGRLIDPTFNMLDEARPFVRKMLGSAYIVTSLLGKKATVLSGLVSSLSSLPADLARIASLARAGRLRIEFEHRGLERMTSEIERSSNRISFSLVVAALVLASCLIMVFGAGKIPFHRAVGITGFVFAAIVGIWLLINIVRSGRV